MCSHDGSLQVWDLERNTQVEKAWQDEGSGVMPTIAFSPDGKKAASGNEDGAVRLWDGVDTGKVQYQKVDGAHKGIVVYLLKSRRKASDERIVRWNIQSVECRERRAPRPSLDQPLQGMTTAYGLFATHQMI